MTLYDNKPAIMDPRRAERITNIGVDTTSTMDELASGFRKMAKSITALGGAFTKLNTALGATAAQPGFDVVSIERKTVTVPKAKEILTDADIELMRDVLDQMLMAISEHDIELRVDAPVLSKIKLSDDGWSTKPITSDMVLFPSYSHVGKTGKPLIGLKLEEMPANWQSIEMSLADFDKAFPMVGIILCTKLGLVDQHGEPTIEEMEGLFDHLFQAAILMREEKRETVKRDHKADPTFGMF